MHPSMTFYLFSSLLLDKFSHRLACLLNGSGVFENNIEEKNDNNFITLTAIENVGT